MIKMISDACHDVLYNVFVDLTLIKILMIKMLLIVYFF